MTPFGDGYFCCDFILEFTIYGFDVIALKTLNGSNDSYTSILLLVIYILDYKADVFVDEAIRTDVFAYLHHLTVSLCQIHTTLLYDFWIETVSLSLE